ncbi:hypothetical protein DVH24_005636, partial [Malus domestica]
NFVQLLQISDASRLKLQKKAAFLYLFSVRALGLMRIVRGMQRSFPEEQSVLGWKKTFSQGIGVTVPKARTRDKHNSKFGVL